MSKSFVPFMEHLIDYAGMFPTANLELENAFRNFLNYQLSDERWMLNNFVIPARKLISLSVLCEKIQPIKIVELSVLLTNENLFSEFYKSLNNDINNIDKFDLEGIKISTFELKLPHDLTIIDNYDKITDFIDRIYYSVSNAVKSPAKVFIESGIKQDWKYLLPIFIETLAEFRNKNCDVGLKFRAGGVTADDFPSAEQVVLSLYSCKSSNIPFKATAGLHHPIRHFNTGVNSFMHGFLNVFGAGIITHKYNLLKDKLIEIISDENSKDFIFDDTGFKWKNYFLDIDEIESARNNFMISFGSCSFDEPREDLKKLNLLR